MAVVMALRIAWRISGERLARLQADATTGHVAGAFAESSEARPDELPKNFDPAASERRLYAWCGLHFTNHCRPEVPAQCGWIAAG